MRRFVSLVLSAAAAAALFSAFACRQESPTTSIPPEKEGQVQAASPSDASSYLAVYPYLAVARGEGPSDITQAAINALGGMGRFVNTGADVILKPNICVGYRSYEYAATTNPEVVGTVTRLCREAGARRVRVMDSPFSGTAAGAYNQSGIEGAVKAAGGEMEIMSNIKYRDVAIPAGKAIKSWPVYGEILDADVLINLPIAKHHGSAGLTLGMKNLLGIVKNPNQFHLHGLHQCIVDLNSAIHPTLTIVDAVRILTRGGPTGGNLDDVKMANTVIASTDIVAADAFAATLFGLKGGDIEYIRKSADLGLGSMNMDNIMIEEMDV